MRIRDIKMIFKNITPDNPIIVDTTMSDLIKIQIEGDGNCDVKVYGQITKDVEFSNLAIIRDEDYGVIDSISGKGIYTVSAEGCRNIKIEINSISGNLTGYMSEVGYS